MVKLARPRNALKKKPCILRPPGLMICWKFEYSRYFWKTTDSDLIGRKSFHRTSFWHSDNPKSEGKEPVNYLFGNAFLELCVIIVFKVFHKVWNVWKSEKGESYVKGKSYPFKVKTFERKCLMVLDEATIILSVLDRKKAPKNIMWLLKSVGSESSVKTWRSRPTNG